MFKSIAIFVLLAGLAAGDHNFNTAVTTTSSRVAAMGNAATVELVVPQVVTQGQLVAVGQRVYMAVAAGTVTNAPTHTRGDAGHPVLRAVPGVRGPTGAMVSARRTVVFVDNLGTNRVWLSVGGGPAVVERGIRLDPTDRIWIGSDKAVNAVSEGSASVVATQEIY